MRVRGVWGGRSGTRLSSGVPTPALTGVNLDDKGSTYPGLAPPTSTPPELRGSGPKSPPPTLGVQALGPQTRQCAGKGSESFRAPTQSTSWRRLNFKDRKLIPRGANVKRDPGLLRHRPGRTTLRVSRGDTRRKDTDPRPTPWAQTRMSGVPRDCGRVLPHLDLSRVWTKETGGVEGAPETLAGPGRR